MSSNSYQVCTRCVMDTTDPQITFNEQGICNHCQRFDLVLKKNWFPNQEGQKKLEEIVNKIQQEGRKKEYDSILGLSGGVDSSYLGYQAKKLGLRPLVVHIDAGWNSEFAVRNIENIVKKLGFDLYTYVVDWEEVKDLQLAFLKASVANQDIPQDHAFFAGLYRLAAQNSIRYVLSGSNIATESVLPTAWGYNAMDSHHLRAIHQRFGQRQLKTYPIASFFDIFFYYPYIKGMKVIKPLNYMPYNKQEAMAILEKELDWQDYGGKHYESRFTKFFQGYYLPKKFGYDKRKAHLSSLILSDQITREEALQVLQKEPFSQESLHEDQAFIIKKLGLTEAEFEELLNLPNKSYRDYPSNQALIEARLLFAQRTKRFLKEKLRFL